jgi:hypothetical protein
MSMIAYQKLYLAEKLLDLASPTSMTRIRDDTADHSRHAGTNSDEEFDFFDSAGMMTGTGASSPFIKDEPDDWNFTSNGFMPNQQNYSMQMNQQFGQSAPGSIDPSELTMQNSNFGQYSFGSQQNLSSSFHMGNSGIGDDELLDLDLNDTSKAHGQIHNQGIARGNTNQDTGNVHNYFADQNHQAASNNQHQMHQVYSNTPDGGPIQSPFINGGFNYGQFIGSHQLSQHVSPYMRPVGGNGQMRTDENNFANARKRTSIPHGMDRKPSDSRSPLTPKTPALGGLNLGGTPDSGNFSSLPIHTSNLNHHRHQKSLSGQWDSNSGSLQSYVDSPLASPGHTTNHAQISEVLKSGKHASLPAKVETGHHPAPAYQSQEAKRRRRRESHNMVERRRRDNINERIQELSHLVPQHRLEDEKVRKHLANNGPLSPTLAATGMSPPQATSLLAGGGRRATGAGNITMGIPIEEKDKGPNKGDILNGSVGWTRDLMWALHVKLQQEQQLAEIIASLGGEFPFTETEDEKRMRTELMDAMDKNDVRTFEYTRHHGSGLRVPKHTNVAGDPLGQLGPMGTLSPQSLSPGVQSGGSGANSGGHGQPQFWTHSNSGRGSFSLKEEDEFGMEMN